VNLRLPNYFQNSGNRLYLFFMKTTYLLGLGLFLAATATWAGPQITYERYQIILDRKPFGAVPPPAPIERNKEPENLFAQTFRISALVKQENGTIQVGLTDSHGNKSYILTEGQSENGIELVYADYDKEEVVFAQKFRNRPAQAGLQRNSIADATTTDSDQ
jgi:hypothetical protein